jgi:hypothetical protein
MYAMEGRVCLKARKGTLLWPAASASDHMSFVALGIEQQMSVEMHLWLCLSPTPLPLKGPNLENVLAVDSGF